MTDRTVNVRLTMTVAEYERAAQRAAGDTMKLEGQIKQAQRTSAGAFKSMGDSATHHLGRMLLAYGGVTGAVLGLGKILRSSIKDAQDFQAKMELVATQAGASQKEVNRLSKVVLALAPAVGVGPKDLADGLYHVESAGFRGAQAISILTAAAKASRIGMSGMEETTQALIGTMAVGLPDVHSASDAIAFLNKIVGVGDMRMTKLAQSISTGVLPSFKSAGLGMRDYGAALATLTDNVTPADEAASRLRMTISLMAAPSDAAKKALGSIGLSGSALAKDFHKPQGLLVAVMDLKKHLENSGKTAVEQNQVIEKAFGGGRTSGAILTLLEESGRLTQKYHDLGDASQRAAQLALAWEQTKHTSAQNTAELSASLDTLKVRAGADLLPEVTRFVKYLDGTAVPAAGRFLTGMEKGTGPGGEFAKTLRDLGGDAKQAWTDAEPIFTFIAAHPHLFAELAKDAAVIAVSLKAFDKLKGLGLLGGRAGAGTALGGAIGRGSPVPVWVMNPGGIGGAGGAGTQAVERFAVTKLDVASMAVAAYYSYKGITADYKTEKKNEKLAGETGELQSNAGRATTRGQIHAALKDADALAKKDHVQTLGNGKYVFDPKNPANVTTQGTAAAVVAEGLRAKLGRLNDRLEDPRFAKQYATDQHMAAVQAQHDVMHLNTLLTGGVLKPLDQANGKIKTMGQLLLGVSNHAYQIHIGVVVDDLGRQIITDSGGTYVQGRGGKLGLDSPVLPATTAAPKSNLTTSSRTAVTAKPSSLTHKTDRSVTVGTIYASDWKNASAQIEEQQRRGNLG